jgi:chromosome segregation ATPase
MTSLRRLFFPVASLTVLLIPAAPALAQTARSGGGGNAQLMQEMQQLASERTALQAENARMKKELDDLRKERDSLKKGQQAMDGRVKATEAALARSTTEHNTTEQELKQSKERMQELVAKFRETIQTLRDVENDRATAKQALEVSNHDLKVCVDHNSALYKLDEEVLDRLEHQSAWSRVATLEPFTKIKRVQLENLVDDFKSRADEQRLKPGFGASAAAAGGAGQSSGASPSAPATTSAPAPGPASQPPQTRQQN